MCIRDRFLLVRRINQNPSFPAASGNLLIKGRIIGGRQYDIRLIQQAFMIGTSVPLQHFVPLKLMDLLLCFRGGDQYIRCKRSQRARSPCGDLSSAYNNEDVYKRQPYYQLYSESRSIPDILAALLRRTWRYFSRKR